MNIVEKYINEGRDDLPNFVDNVVRLLMGDKMIAINNLKKIKFDFNFSVMSTEEYNKTYNALYKTLFEVLRKELRDRLLLGVM